MASINLLFTVLSEFKFQQLYSVLTFYSTLELKLSLLKDFFKLQTEDLDQWYSKWLVDVWLKHTDIYSALHHGIYWSASK